MPQNLYETITEIAKRRGFYWPSFEIYGGQSGFITYGDLGYKLKRNIEETWRHYFTRRQGILELDDPVINPEKVFQASGHLENFKEYSTECTKCGNGFRADHLIEENTGLENVEAMGAQAIRNLLNEKKIRCPRCGGELKEPTMILTMFKTEIGVTGDETAYARPETAQGMFLNYRRSYQYAREKLPFALAQIGKVLRNEISPRRGLVRLREFTIMELELFFDPENPQCQWLHEVQDQKIKLLTEEMEAEGTRNPLDITIKEAIESNLILTEWQGYFMGMSQRFVDALDIPPERQRFRAHLPEERSHYSTQTYDHEILSETWGWVEVSGLAYRTDYDLKAHQEASGLDMTTLRDDGSRVIPHVVEPSYGLDRLFLFVLANSYERKKNRNLFHLPRCLAPFQASVLPLMNKDNLDVKAREVTELLQNRGYFITYDESGSIGRRYARSDEAGTPLAITIDYDTLENDIVTIRDRDTWDQVLCKIEELPDKLRSYYYDLVEFKKLGKPLK